MALPVSTALGATIGVGATLLADRARWRREGEARRLDVRRELYTAYLAALSKMRTNLDEFARDTSIPPDERRQRVREAFLAPGAYEVRHQLAITAPGEVIEASTVAFRILRDTRDRIAEGADADSSVYSDQEDAFDIAIADLRRAMREDLGAPPLDH